MTRKTNKTYKDYNEYLNSPKWEQVKKDFYNEYPGYNNVCEISGTKSDNMNLHHWRYESDWNNDSYDNVILVCKEVHEWIHAKRPYDIDFGKDEPHGRFSTYDRKIYLCEAIREWIEDVVLFQKIRSSNAGHIVKTDLQEEIKDKDALIKLYSELAWRLSNAKA